MGNHLNTSEAAKLMTVSEETVRELCKRGVLQGARKNTRGRWEIPEGAVEQWIQQSIQSPSPALQNQPPANENWATRLQTTPRWQLLVVIGVLVALLAGIAGFLNDSLGVIDWALTTLATPTPSPTLTRTPTRTASPTATIATSPTPTVTPTPLPFAPAANDEVLILIATFYTSANVPDTEPHHEIRLKIEEKASELGDPKLRVAVEPTTLRAEDRIQAQALGERYNATLVIWGADTGVRFTVNFLNIRQPDFQAADVKISEVGREGRTQLANPTAFAGFVTEEMPSQLAFLALFAMGQSYYGEEKYVDAITTIEAAVEEPFLDATQIEGVTDAYFRLGWLYSQESVLDHGKALAAYNEVVMRDPTYAPVYNNRAILQVERGDLIAAITDFTKAVELDPLDALAYGNRGTAYVEEGNWNAAFADYNRAIELQPDNADFYYNRGNAYGKQGEIAKAIADFSKSLNLNPNHAAAYHDRGLAHTFQNKFEAAINDYNRALDLDHTNSRGYINRGQAYLIEGEFELAIADFTRAIRLDPTNPLPYHSRGLVYLNQGEITTAIADHNKAIELDPTYPFAYYSRALLHWNQEDLNLALDDFRRYLELSPNAENRSEVEAFIADLEERVSQP